MAVALLLAVGFALFSLGVMVAGLRTNRDDAGMAPSDDAALEKSQGDRAGAASSDPDRTQESLNCTHWFI